MFGSKIKTKKDSFNYAGCEFECRIKKKTMFGSKTKYVYVKKNNLIISNDPYKKQPDKIVELLPEMQIIWIHDQKKDPSRIKGFKFILQKEEFEYRGEEFILLQLKETISKYCFQFRLQDEYDVISQIGKGNYARVYSIKHRITGYVYACKCFEKKKVQGMEKGMISLHNEIEIMRALTNHVNVVKLKEVFEGENTYYLVMEISEGSSLYDEIKAHENKLFTIKEVQVIMKGLVDGISYLANNKVIHRDLKPENLLFKWKGKYDRLQIVDFGLASFQDRAPYIFPKCGTPGFVAPEIANLVNKQSAYSEVCDVFSIGVVFHILLIGEAVFPGKKFNDVLSKNKQCKINKADKKYDNLEPAARSLLFMLLEKDPEQRISANDALQHEYFLQKPLINKKNPSLDETPEIQTSDTMEQQPQRNNIIQKSENIINVDYAIDETLNQNHGSFYVQEPLFIGPRKAIKDRNDILFTSMDHNQLVQQTIDLQDIQQINHVKKPIIHNKINEAQEEEEDQVSQPSSFHKEQEPEEHKENFYSMSNPQSKHISPRQSPRKQSDN